jgi:hypothetical protein
MYYNFIVQYPDTDVFDQEVENPVLYTASMIHTIPSVSNPGYNGYANYDNSAIPTVKQTSYDPDYYNIYWDISYNWDTPIQKTKKTFNITQAIVVVKQPEALLDKHIKFMPRRKIYRSMVLPDLVTLFISG